MNYTIQQAADKIGVHPKTLRRWEDQKKFISKRTLGNQRRFSEADIKVLQKIKSGEPVTTKYDKVLNLDEAAQKLKVSTDTIRRWTKQGKLYLTVNDQLEPGYSDHELERLSSDTVAKLHSDTVAKLHSDTVTQGHGDTAPQLEETVPWLKNKKWQKFFAYGAMTALLLSAGLTTYILMNRPNFLANPSVEQLDLTQDIEVALPRTASFLDGHITIGTDTGDYFFLDQNANLYLKNLALIEGGVHTSSLQLLPSQQPEGQIGRQYVDAETGNLMYFDGLEWLVLSGDGGTGGKPTLQDVYDSGNTTVVADNQDFDITLGNNASASATSFRLTLAGVTSAFTILGGASQEVLTVNDDAVYPVTISQPTQVLGNLYAPQFIDSDNLGFFLDPGNTGVSLNVAGNATISATLTFSANGEYLTNSTDNYLISSAGLGVGGGTTYGINSVGSVNFKSGNFEDTLTATAKFDANGQLDLGDGGDTITLNGSSITLTGFNACTALETDGSGVLSCGSDAVSTSAIYWTLTDGVIRTVNQTTDVLIGGTATTSAKFAFLNVNSGTPTASISGQIVLSGGNRSIQSTSAKDLILGGGTTGNILLQPNQDNTNYFQFTSDLTNLTLATTDGANLIINPAGSLYLNSSILDLSTQTVAVTLNDAVNALNFDSDTLSIDASGNKVGIGTTAPSYKLDVNGTIRGYGITDSSDIRLKKNVTSLEGSLSKLLQLKGISYNWIDENAYGSAKQLGFIAQKVETLFPELVATDSEGYKSIAYGKFAAIFVEAIKELNQKVEDLAERQTAFISPLPEDHFITRVLETNMIKPLSDSDLILQLTDTATSSSQLSINNSAGETVASINSQGEAQFASVSAQTVTTSELIAQNIKSTTIDNLREKIAKLAEDYRTQTATASADSTSQEAVNATALLELLQTADGSEPYTASELAYLEVASINADAGFFSEYLAVLGSATITDLNVSNLLTVNQNLLLTQNSISTLNDTLYLQPSGAGAINFLAGLMIMDDTGQVIINGDLAVTGNLTVSNTLIASQIEPQQEQSLDIRIASQSAVSIYNLLSDQAVASISGDGSGSFASLNLKASGTATISAGTNNVAVPTEKLSPSSQVIVTFTGSYAPATKYWVTKQPLDQLFSVFVNYPVNNPTPFDWLIIN